MVPFKVNTTVFSTDHKFLVGVIQNCEFRNWIFVNFKAKLDLVFFVENDSLQKILIRFLQLGDVIVHLWVTVKRVHSFVPNIRLKNLKRNLNFLLDVSLHTVIRNLVLTGNVSLN